MSDDSVKMKTLDDASEDNNTDEPTVELTDEPTGEPTDDPNVESTSEPTVEQNGAPTDEPTDKPTNTKSLNAIKETVIEIEGDVKEKKVSEAEQLKQAVFTDQGLQSVYVIAGKGKKRRTKQDQYGSDKYSNRLVWVQAINMTGEPSGTEIDEGSRGPFIRKVFGILFFCMLFTCIFAMMTFFMPEIRLFFRTPAGLIVGVIAVVVLFPVTYAISCSECARVPPCNFICLILGVLCFTILFGVITAMYSLRIVFMALAITTVVVLLCFLLAFTPIDFTKFYIFVVMALLVLCAFSMVVSIMVFVLGQKFTLIRLVLCFAMTLVQSMLLVIEIQMVIGGKTVAMGEDDYVLGAFLLYTSILNLFFKILRLIALFEELDF